MNVIKLSKGIRKTFFSFIILFHGVFLYAQITLDEGEPFIEFDVQETSISPSEINLHLTTSIYDFPLSSGWKAKLVLYKDLYCGNSVDVNLTFEPGIQVHDRQLNFAGEIELEISKQWSLPTITNSIVISDISTKRYHTEFPSIAMDSYATVFVVQPLTVATIAPEPTEVGFNELYTTSITYGTGCGMHDIPVGSRSGEDESNISYVPPVTTAVYPTLASSYLQIDVATDENVDLQVFDMSGQKLLSLLNVRANGYQLDLSQLSNGTYFLNIQSKNKRISSRKFIVQK